MMNILDIIEKKKKGLALTKDEIDYFVNGVVSGEIKDYQTSAFLMAVVLKGMTPLETFNLTMAMKDSGDDCLSVFCHDGVFKHFFDVEFKIFFNADVFHNLSSVLMVDKFLKFSRLPYMRPYMALYANALSRKRSGSTQPFYDIKFRSNLKASAFKAIFSPYKTPRFCRRPPTRVFRDCKTFSSGR